MFASSLGENIVEAIGAKFGVSACFGVHLSENKHRNVEQVSIFRFCFEC